MQITKEAALAFLDRMKELERMKTRRLKEPRTESAGELLARGDALRQYAQSVRPEWPTEEHLREDFRTHARVAEMIRSVRSKTGR